MSDTRKDQRALLSVKIRYKSATFDEFVEHYSNDISKSGVFIKSGKPLAIGTLLKFEFQLQDRSPVIAGVGRVVWKREPEDSGADRPSGMGIKFIKMDPQSRQLVQAIVAKRGGQPNNFDHEVDEAVDPFLPADAASDEFDEDRKTEVRHAHEFLASTLTTANANRTTRNEADAAADRARQASARPVRSGRPSADDIFKMRNESSPFSDFPENETTKIAPAFSSPDALNDAMRSAFSDVEPEEADAAAPLTDIIGEPRRPSVVAPPQAHALPAAPESNTRTYVLLGLLAGLIALAGLAFLNQDLIFSALGFPPEDESAPVSLPTREELMRAFPAKPPPVQAEPTPSEQPVEGSEMAPSEQATAENTGETPDVPASPKFIVDVVTVPTGARVTLRGQTLRTPATFELDQSPVGLTLTATKAGFARAERAIVEADLNKASAHRHEALIEMTLQQGAAIKEDEPVPYVPPAAAEPEAPAPAPAPKAKPVRRTTPKTTTKSAPTETPPTTDTAPSTTDAPKAAPAPTDKPAPAAPAPTTPAPTEPTAPKNEKSTDAAEIDWS
ncbi:MAG: TIGR02266 family protein [Polyangiales bacterium]